jgi:mRNA-degrading endonuclease RelE of RelBE toxin-antitoxin system
MSWQVFFKKSAKKQMVKMPEYVAKAVRALVRDIE